MVGLLTGVYLSLKEAVYANNSLTTITEIGKSYESDNSVKCITDKMPCCSQLFRFGWWYFPDGNEVPHQGAATSLYRWRNEDGTVYLSRLNSDITHPVGQFCCVVPDATDANQTLCINISEFASHKHAHTALKHSFKFCFPLF